MANICSHIGGNGGETSAEGASRWITSVCVLVVDQFSFSLSREQRFRLYRARHSIGVGRSIDQPSASRLEGIVVAARISKSRLFLAARAISPSNFHKNTPSSLPVLSFSISVFFSRARLRMYVRAFCTCVSTGIGRQRAIARHSRKHSDVRWHCGSM